MNTHLPAHLILVRHAESARNLAKAGQVFFVDDQARGDLNGEADHNTPLTDAGWAEARCLGVRLREVYGSFEVVFHSGYRRTRETVGGILEAWSPTERAAILVREHLFLRERDSGYTFNMTSAEARTNFPWLEEHWLRIPPIVISPSTPS